MVSDLLHRATLLLLPLLNGATASEPEPRFIIEGQDCGATPGCDSIPDSTECASAVSGLYGGVQGSLLTVGDYGNNRPIHCWSSTAVNGGQDEHGLNTNATSTQGCEEANRCICQCREVEPIFEPFLPPPPEPPCSPLPPSEPPPTRPPASPPPSPSQGRRSNVGSLIRR